MCYAESIVAFPFAFDAPFQLMQALAYKGLQSLPTGVDFMDVMLLAQMEVNASLALLEVLLSVVIVL